MIREFPNEVLLEVLSHLLRSGWNSVHCLSKTWSVTAAKPVLNVIRVDRSDDRAMSWLKALSNRKYLRQITSRFQGEVKLAEPNLNVDEFF